MRPWQRKAAAGAGALAILASIAGWYEGMRTTPYQDGVGVWTVCQGVTAASGIPAQYHVVITPGKRLTGAQCEQLDTAAQRQALATVHTLVHTPLSAAQQAAFADFVYNVGPRNFARSTALVDLNRGEIRAACSQLLRWVYAGGRIEPGLVARRRAEYGLCTEGLH